MIQNIDLICKIIEFDSKLLYNFICSNKNFNININYGSQKDTVFDKKTEEPIPKLKKGDNQNCIPSIFNFPNIINFKIYENYKNQKAYLLNKIFNLWYTRFYELHNDLIKFSIGKEDTFRNMIYILEKRGVFILSVGKE